MTEHQRLHNPRFCDSIVGYRLLPLIKTSPTYYHAKVVFGHQIHDTLNTSLKLAFRDSTNTDRVTKVATECEEELFVCGHCYLFLEDGKNFWPIYCSTTKEVIDPVLWNEFNELKSNGRIDKV